MKSRFGTLLTRSLKTDKTSYNEGATTHENLLKYIDYLKENLEKVTEYAEYVAETVNSNLLLEDEAGKEVEEIEDEEELTDNLLSVYGFIPPES